eukprot:6838454-Lingulodinium_polyedra.AAC.1
MACAERGSASKRTFQETTPPAAKSHRARTAARSCPDAHPLFCKSRTQGPLRSHAPALERPGNAS